MARIGQLNFSGIGANPFHADILSAEFEPLAIEIFKYQAKRNPLFSKYLRLLKRDPATVESISEIPFLPIQFFKNHVVKSGRWQEKTTFSSSGTSGQTPSRHFVRSPDFYLKNAVRGFEQFYGDSKNCCFLALLPSYLERGGSSLVAMAARLIENSTLPESGFFLHDFQLLEARLNACKSANYKTVLLGVSFALLDFAEQFPLDLQGMTVMETGGMKGRRKEMTRPELHGFLKKRFNLPSVHSEYGMTELFSQAYSSGEGIFRPMATMRVLATETNDPFQVLPPGKTGVLNVVDLANLDTCSFIATEDVGKVFRDGSFEVLGRLDAAELRGCNLMVE